MEPDMDMLKQVRKALNDIRATLATDGEAVCDPVKALYQLDLLREMIDAQPSTRQPWSFYRPRVDEEFS